jgi:N-acetylglutamate synthase/N-acetylornithine aminotransferase
MVEIKVTGSDTEENARKVAKAIAVSQLCEKRLFFGGDPTG